MNQLPEIDLLMLGKTGNGKSATGNTILGRKAFKSKSSSTSVTVDVASEVTRHNGRIIKVVDGPGVGDTRMDDEAGMKLVMDAMQNAIAMNVRGYHAFLLVVRFGGRFTKEDKQSIELLKNIFGASFVRNYCILIITHGDNFENESEDTGQTFEEWCDEQEGILKEVMLECDKRVVLFDNGTRDKSRKAEQIDRLLAVVDSLQMQGNRYCDEHFDRAKDARERAMVTAKEPQIREETMAETSLILQDLQQVQNLGEPKEQLEPLKELKARVDGLYETIKSQDKGTGALHGLLETVESIRRTVYSEIESCQRMITEFERRRAEEHKNKEERERMERQLREQQEEMKRQHAKERRELELRYEQIRRENERRVAEQSRGRGGGCTIL